LNALRSLAAARARRCGLPGTPPWPRSGGAPCSAAALAFWKADLHDWFALPKEFDCVWKRPREDCPEAGVWHVPTPKPQDLWRRAEPTYEIDEVLVLREDYDLRLASLVEDLGIFRLSQAQVPNVHRVHSELPANPPTKDRRDVGVQPEDHGRTTAWLTRLLANRKQA